MGMRRFQEEITNWMKGVIVAETASDKIPIDAASRARNAAWVKTGYPSKRKGTLAYTPSAQSGRSPIQALGNFNGINWTISLDGKWSKVSAGGAYSPMDSGNPSPFTAALSNYPSTAIAKNLLFAVNGTDMKKTDGTTVYNFGISPMAAPTVTDSGVSGNPSGIYHFSTVPYNANTGHPGSSSVDAQVSVTGHKITVSWTFPTDPQVTHVRVNVFKESLSTQFFQLIGTDVTPAPDPTTGGYTASTTSITVNVTDADINNLLLKAPSLTENNPPPTGTKAIFYHGSRMFATDGSYLYFSKVDDPESFDPANDYEPVNTQDGQQIVAMATLVDQHLVIFKDRSSYILIGPDDPNTWEIQELDILIGCTSLRSIVFTEGSIWWEAIQGLMRLVYTGPYTISRPQRMDSPNINERIEGLNDANIGMTCAAYDIAQQRLMFAVPQAFETVNNIILPFNNRLNLFEDIWDPHEVAALGTFIVGGQPVVMLGSYQGRLFEMWQLPYLDGVRATDNSGNPFTLQSLVTAAGITSLTDSLATFDTTGDGLRDCMVTAIDPTGLFTERNVIQSNTGTVLTTKYNWTVTPLAGWTYNVGSPYFELDTKHMHPTSMPDKDGSSFYNRNFKRVLVKATTDTAASNIVVLPIIDGDLANLQLAIVMNINTGGAQFDIDKWDIGKFGTGKATVAHHGVGLHGHTCGIRIRNTNPGEGLILLGVGLYGTELLYKY